MKPTEAQGSEEDGGRRKGQQQAVPQCRGHRHLSPLTSMKDSPPGESGEGGLVTGLGDGAFTTQHIKPLSLLTREVDPDSKIQKMFWTQVWLMPASKETLRMNEEMSRTIFLSHLRGFQCYHREILQNN